jgi:hypothetical protein
MKKKPLGERAEENCEKLCFLLIQHNEPSVVISSSEYLENTTINKPRMWAVMDFCFEL